MKILIIGSGLQYKRRISVLQSETQLYRYLDLDSLIQRLIKNLLILILMILMQQLFVTLPLFTIDTHLIL